MQNFGDITTIREKVLFSLNLIAAIACAVAMVSQLGASSFFGFEVFLSLLPQLLFYCCVIIILTVFWQPRLAASLAALTFLTATPFAFFSNYDRPSGSACVEDDCFRIMTINLWSESDYLPALAELIVEYEVDILAINEASVYTIHPDYQDVYFPQYDTIVHATWENMPRGMGNPISFLSRVPVESYLRVLEPDTGGRAHIAADLAGQWDGLRIVVAHAMTPTSQTGLDQRNTLIDQISQTAEESESFIVLGDFNMTPWSPKFSTLPGTRAGNPRFSMTWPSIFPLLGMNIDHIMFSEDLELVEYEILRSIGSDHYPVLARFRRKD